MKDDTPNEALKSHTEMVVLRLLVESMLMSMHPRDHAAALVAFDQACERLLAELLASSQREALVTAVQRAVEWQVARLENLGAALPRDPM